MNSLILAVVSGVAYVGAAGLQGLGLAARLNRFRPVVLGLGFFAVVLHAGLLHRWIDVEGGQNLSVVNMLSLVSWLVSLLVLLTALFKPLENLTVLIFPLAGVSIVLVSVFPGSQVINTASDSKILVHILSSVLAFSVFCVAALQAVVIAVQERRLRTKRAGGIIQMLPPLETMETLLFKIIGVGFVLLTAVLTTSIYFYINAITTPALLQKTVLVVVAWVIFAVLLSGRFFSGWRGTKAIYCTLSGFLLLGVAYFGSKLLLT